MFASFKNKITFFLLLLDILLNYLKPATFTTSINNQHRYTDFNVTLFMEFLGFRVTGCWVETNSKIKVPREFLQNSFLGCQLPMESLINGEKEHDLL